jgi:hypothetical protein
LQTLPVVKTGEEQGGMAYLAAAILAMLLTIPIWAGSEFSAPKEATAACPVTKPNGSTPPGEQVLGPGSHGNGELWVVLWPEGGKVVFRPGGPGFVLADGSLSMKFGWWRGGRGKLTIEGKRLDAPAPPLRASIPDGYGDTGFQATALIFPTVGCWLVTGKVGNGKSLRFVTQVIRVAK